MPEVCLRDCPNPSEDSLNWVCDYPEGDVHLSTDDWIDRNYDYFAHPTPELRNTSLQLQGPCYPIVFPSVNVYWSCKFIARASTVFLRHWQLMGGVSIVEDILIDKAIHRSINSRSSVLKRYVADVGKAWPVLIVCGGIIPLFLSVIWLLLIWHFVAGMPWITVIIFNVLIISVIVFYYLKDSGASSAKMEDVVAMAARLSLNSKALILLRNKIKEWPGAVLKSISSLTCLKLDNNPLRQILSDGFQATSKLIILDLSANAATLPEPAIFSSLLQLQELYLRWMQISEVLSDLLHLQQLRILDLSQNTLQSVPEGFKHLLFQNYIFQTVTLLHFHQNWACLNSVYKY